MDVVEQRLRAMLADDALALVPGDGAVALVRTGVRRRRRRARVAVAGAAVVAAAAVSAVVVTPALLAHRDRGRSPALTNPPPSRTWALRPPIALPPQAARVTAIAVTDAGGIVWVGARGRLARVDGTTGATTSYAVGGTPVSVAATPRLVWVAVVTRTGCALEERDAAGARRHVFALPCDRGTAPSVTANGGHAWVVSPAGGAVVVRTYDGAAHTVVATAAVAGGPTGTAPLAIGGDAVYVLSSDPRGARVTRLSAADLTAATDVAVSDPVQRLAFGSGRLMLAGPAGVLAADRQLHRVVRLGRAPSLDITTGADLVWSVTPSTTSDLVARDGGTGRGLGTVVLAATVTRIVASGDSVWAVVRGAAADTLVAVVPVR